MAYIFPKIVRFLQNHRNLIETGQFDSLLESARSSFQNLDEYFDLINLLEEAGIDILQSTDEVPYKFFYGRDIERIVLPNCIKKIGTSAFEYCGKLQEVSFPGGRESIKPRAFLECYQLYRVVFRGTKKQWEGVEVAQAGNHHLFRCGIDCIDGLVEYVPDPVTGWRWIVKES